MRDYFEELREGSGGWYRFKDKLTGRTDTCSVSFEAKRVFFHKESSSMSVVAYVKEVESCSIKEAYEILGTTREDYLFSKQFLPRARLLSSIAMPEGYKGILTSSAFGRRARTYLKSRNVSIGLADELGFGYLASGPNIGRLLMPIFINGICIAYTQRLIGDGEPKYIAEGNVSAGFFNQDAISIYKDIYCTEGIFDAVSVGPNCIARNGLSLSSNQLSILINSKAKNFYLIPDRGYEAQTLAAYLPLLPYKNLYICEMTKAKDVDELGGIKSLKFIQITYLNLKTWSSQ